MEYKGVSQNAQGQSQYGFDINPYNANDILTRTDDNALAPRHAHFEYRTKDSTSAA